MLLCSSHFWLIFCSDVVLLKSVKLDSDDCILSYGSFCEYFLAFLEDQLTLSSGFARDIVTMPYQFL